MWSRLRRLLTIADTRAPTPLGRWSMDGHHFWRAENATRDSCGDSLCARPGGAAAAAAGTPDARGTPDVSAAVSAAVSANHSHEHFSAPPGGGRRVLLRATLRHHHH